MSITVKRKENRFDPNPARVIPRFHLPNGPERAVIIISRVLELSDEDVNLTLNHVLRNFSKQFQEHVNMQIFS